MLMHNSLLSEFCV